MRKNRTLLLSALSLGAMIALSFPAPTVAQSYADMTYFTVPGCVAVDTRVAGGAFSTNETRTYTVTGSSSFATQGGSTSGCGIPAISSGVSQVQAVNLNVIAIATSAPGFLRVWPSDFAGAAISLIDFAAGSTTATNVVVPIKQNPSSSGDIKVLYAGAGGHLLVAVTGYYAKPQQTIFVHPVPGNATASGTALINSLSGITDASSTRHYVVKLDPGIYDLGTSPLNLQSYVDLAGAGQQATVIRGTAYGSNLNDGTLVANGITGVEIHDLQVQVTGSSTATVAMGLWMGMSPITVRNATFNTTTGGINGASWGIRSVDANSILENVNIAVSGGFDTYGIVFEGADSNSFPEVRRAVISASGASGQNNGIYIDESAGPILRDVEIQASGGSQVSAVFADYGNGSSILFTMTVIDGNLQATGGTTNYGVNVTGASNTIILEKTRAVASTGTSYGLHESNGGNTFTIDHSQLVGGTGSVALLSVFSCGASQLSGTVFPPGVASCAGCYSGSYVALNPTCG